MKRLLLISLISGIWSVGASAATLQWWQQPTICRASSVTCYPSMGTGYDYELWDKDSDCRGMKLICPAALVAGGTEPMPISKSKLPADAKVIKKDFDTTVLASGCFGARKTQNNGTQASVNGKFVNVYCRGILTNPDEIVTTGEITLGAQPTCQELADNGYAAVVNGKCYGKYYNPSEYYIECGTDIIPTRLIILNGADYMAASKNTPSTKAEADVIFKQMQDISSVQRAQYFKGTEE